MAIQTRFSSQDSFVKTRSMWISPRDIPAWAIQNPTKAPEKKLAALHGKTTSLCSRFRCSSMMDIVPQFQAIDYIQYMNIVY